MKADELVSRLESAANTLEDRGFACLSRRTAEEMARSFAASTFPLRLFLAWLTRTPEAAEEIGETLLTVVDRESTPGVRVTRGFPKEKKVGEWTVTVDLKAEPVAKPEVKNAAQTSEPVAPEPIPKPEVSGVSPMGVRGATASGLSVSLGDAARFLGKDAIRTRPVAPKDSEPRSLGVTEGFQGQAILKDSDGKPVQAIAKFNDGERVVEFLDKRGPLILSRLVGGKDAGTVVTICIEFIEPADRDRVLLHLSKLRGADDAFNFSPFDGSPDPWDKSKTISHPTTVEEPVFNM